MDDGRPLLRHRLEVGALHVPRQVEVELLVHVPLVEDHRLRVLHTHHTEDDLIVAVLLVELPDLTERLGQAVEEFVNLKLIVDGIHRRIPLLRGKAVVLLERRLQEGLGVFRVHVWDRTVRVVILVRPALGDHGTRTPAARGTTLRIADGRQHTEGRRVNTRILVRLDLVLPGLARLRHAAGIVQLPGQVLATIQDERVLAVRVAKQACLGEAGVFVTRRHVRVEHRAIDARDAILVGQALVGVDDADLVREPLLRVDERAANGLQVLRRADGDQPATLRLNRFLHPILVPVVVPHQLAQLLGRKILDPVDAGHPLQIQRERRDEQVLIQVKRPDDRITALRPVHRHRGLAGLTQFA